MRIVSLPVNACIDCLGMSSSIEFLGLVHQEKLGLPHVLSDLSLFSIQSIWHIPITLLRHAMPLIYPLQPNSFILALLVLGHCKHLVCTIMHRWALNFRVDLTFACLTVNYRILF